MKQIWCLLCIAVLLAGCASSGTPDTNMPVMFGDESVQDGRWVLNAFHVEGNAYSYQGIYKQAKDGELSYSLTLVFPHSQNYHTVVRHKGEKFKGEIFSQKVRTIQHVNVYVEGHGRPATGETNDKKVADALFHYVYFLDDGKVVFQKSNEELGIDVSNPERAFDKKNLLPILKQLIRENVQPQEPEMEE